MTIEELIAKNPNKSARQIARLAMKDPDLVVTVLAREVERVRRQGTHSVEVAQIGPLLKSYSGERKAATDEMFKALNASFKPTKGADFISWGKATVADHLQRIEFLRVHIAGCQATIRRHEDAIKAIEAAGVACLDELTTESVTA